MSGSVVGRSRGTVIGWKIAPKAWWPELPGKAGNYTTTGSTLFKRLCLDCRKVEVEGRTKFCDSCKRTRHRNAARKHKRRVTVDKLRNSSFGAEALTKVKMTSGYGSSGTPHQADINLDLKEPVT